MLPPSQNKVFIFKSKFSWGAFGMHTGWDKKKLIIRLVRHGTKIEWDNIGQKLIFMGQTNFVFHQKGWNNMGLFATLPFYPSNHSTNLNLNTVFNLESISSSVDFTSIQYSSTPNRFHLL